MGNQLSTWNLSIQSAVDGENFNYNPDYNQAPYIFADYTWFYIGIGATAGKADHLDFQNLFVDSSGLGTKLQPTFCAGAALLLILANICLGCKYKKYWYSRYSGNRYVLPIFVLPPKDQTPLDL